MKWTALGISGGFPSTRLLPEIQLDSRGKLPLTFYDDSAFESVEWASMQDTIVILGISDIHSGAGGGNIHHAFVVKTRYSYTH
jgi:hypothetical protein